MFAVMWGPKAHLALQSGQGRLANPTPGCETSSIHLSILLKLILHSVYARKSVLRNCKFNLS